MTHIPSVEEVDQIAAQPDAVIRNLQITHCYHELALALTARTGIAANWCTFATWASKQAGQTIRKEDLARTLENVLRSVARAQADEIAASAQALGSPRSAAQIQASVGEILNPLAAFDRASEAVARGNRKVFAEIGREFARFAAACLNDETNDGEKLARFRDGLRPGEPPDGQQYLRQAFARYYQAFFEAEPAARAQLMLLANVEIGFHEQTRLQPEIAEAMEAAFMDYNTFRLRLIDALFPNRGWWARLRLFLLRLVNRRSPFDALVEGLMAEARRQARLLITEYMMTIRFPHEVVLRLGSDVPAEFPASLKQITLAELRAMLERIDATPDTPGGSGAVDWSRLGDRLHFIVDLFRCYHESAELFEPPFTPEQVAALKAGRRPAGRL
jgi:hypothetical protein